MKLKVKLGATISDVYQKLINIVNCDMHRSGKPKLSPLLFFGHHVSDRSANYVKITTAAGRELRASSEHIILLAESSHLFGAAKQVPAHVAAPGMFLFSIAPDLNNLGKPHGEMIVSVVLEKAQGLYAPHSYDSDALIVVDGFVCSELTTGYSNRQLWFLKKLLASLHQCLGSQLFGVIHSFLHASQFPESFYSLTVAVRSMMGGLGGKFV
jgi:hypothetical protein